MLVFQVFSSVEDGSNCVVSFFVLGVCVGGMVQTGIRVMADRLLVFADLLEVAMDTYGQVVDFAFGVQVRE